MPSIPQVTQMRERRRSQARRNPLGKIALGVSTLISLLVAGGIILLALTYTNLSRDLPSIETLPLLLEPPNGLLNQPTRLYDRSGEQVILTLENPAMPGREYLPFKVSIPPGYTSNTQLSDNLITAILAVADPGFWNHSGFTFAGFFQDSPSTLAQRLASNLLLQDEPSGLRHALRERLLAAQITSHFGREKVLEWYLNSANFGRLAFGANAAAHLYLGKPASELSLGEAAMLAPIPESPTLNPIEAPQAALERQNLTIQAMLQYRMISPQAGIEASREQIKIQPRQGLSQALTINELEPKVAPAFANLVLDQLQAYIPRSRLERGGLKIITSLDYNLQLQTICATTAQLERLEPTGDDPPALVSEKCEAALLLPTLAVQVSPSSSPLLGEALVMDPTTGQILAMVGELPQGLEQTPLQTHPPGTLVTPFIYLTAFTRGSSPASLVWDIPLEENLEDIQNFADDYNGPVRLRIAMANDYLTPAENMLSQVGVQNVLRTAQQLGIAHSQAKDPAGASSLSLLRDTHLVEIAQAFGIFANQGVLVGRTLEQTEVTGESKENSRIAPLQPVSILRVEDITGSVWLDWESYQSRLIISSQLAYLTTNTLSDETARWPSLGHPNPFEIGRPAATKLGRTASGASNWALGYTPQLVVGVWIGQDDPHESIPEDDFRVQQKAAAGLWHAIIQYASQDLPYQNWTIPEGLSFIPVCDPSGDLPTQDCPNVVDEVFLPGNEPIQNDRLYHQLQINRETGRLATVFTPPDQIEERTYFIAPSQAAEWAQRADLDTPPEDYDLVPIDLPSWPDTMITSPSMFETVRGETPILGKAAGVGFDSFRLQVGQGLNPQAWYQVGKDETQPVAAGNLGLWDTSGLNGLYAIQLLVLREDQSAERVTVLVTVDNQPPVVKVTSPSNGAEILSQERNAVVLRAQVSDDLEVASVKFYLDGAVLATLTQPPYAVSWDVEPGAHTLRVIAQDRAGNSSEESVTFVIR